MPPGVDPGSEAPLPDVSPELVREHLERILASEGLRRAERLRRFLSFVVEETLEGRADGIKEALIAVEVFRRDSSFDPHADSLVRVQARSLRSRLASYYSKEGQEDPLVIELPKGGYLPVFRLRRQSEQAEPSGWWRRHRLRITATAALVLLAAAVAGLGIRMRWWQARPPVASLAVLPFPDLSGESGSGYVADAFVEDLTTALAATPGLRVVARTSSFQFRGKAEDVREIGRKLGVAAVVEGSLRRQAGRVRVTAQLISAADGYHLWGGTFERPEGEIGAVEGEIARSIGRALRLWAPAARVGQTSSFVASTAARDLYWRGRYLRRQWPGGRPRSVELFQQAVRLEPRYARAHAALAYVNASMAFHVEGPPEELLPKARDAAAKALKLDPTLGEAHLALGILSCYFDQDWPAAEAAFRRAIENEPNYATAYNGYAIALLMRSRFDEALDMVKRAIELDPLSFVVSNDLAVILYCSRRYEEAVAQARQTLNVDPKYYPASMLMGLCRLAQGRLAEAVRELEQALRTSEGNRAVLARLGYALGALGNRAAARGILKQLRASPAEDVSYLNLAIVHLGLGDRNAALDSLEEGSRKCKIQLAFIGVEPLLDALRTEPRFLRLKAQLGI